MSVLATPRSRFAERCALLFDALTSAEEMMPLLAMLSIEEILQTRKAALEAQRAGLPRLALARDSGVDC